MAIIGVAQPGQQQQRQKDDPFDKIIKGLQIASSVFGIKSSLEQSEARAQQQQRTQQLIELGDIEIEQAKRKAERESLGSITPGQQRQLFTDIKPEGIDVQKRDVLVQTPEGETSQLKLYSIDEINEKITKNALLAEKSAERAKTKSKEEDALRKEYLKPSQTTFEALTGLKKVESAATNPNPTGATDVSLIFGFMKTIDPGSTVREGEFATAENTRGIPEEIRSRYNKIVSGERLSTQQRANFLVEARRQALGRLELQKIIDDRYTNLSERRGLDVIDVVDPSFGIEFDRITEVLKRSPKTNLLSQPPKKPDNTFLGGIGNLFGGGSTKTPMQPITPPKSQNEIDTFIQNYIQD